MRCTVLIPKQVTGGFYCMSRSMKHFDSDFPQAELLTVFGQMNGKLCFGVWAIYNRCPCGLLKIKMTTYKIGVKMCFEDVFNSSIPFLCQLHIAIDISQWINDSGL